MMKSMTPVSTPPQFSSPLYKEGEEKSNIQIIAQKTARREYVRPSRYTSEFRHDVSNIPSSDKGSQRRRWPIKPGETFGEAWRGKRRKREGGSTGGLHHGTSAFGLSCRRRLLWMRSNVDMQDRAMQVSQWRSRMCDMLVPGAVCRNLLSIDSRLNRIDPSTNIFPPNPERGYRTKFEIILEEVFPNSIE